MGFRRPIQTFRQPTGFMRPPRKPITTSYLTSGTLNIISFGTTVNVGMLVASDSPDKSIITDFSSTIAQVENNSKIVRKGSILKISATSTVDSQLLVIWIYMNMKGNVVAPVTSDAFNTAPLTLANAQLRKYTIFYWKGLLSAQNPRSWRIPLFSRRNSTMYDLTSIRLNITNAGSAGNINYVAYGRFKSIEG